jgi:hypothetical protein
VGQDILGWLRAEPDESGSSYSLVEILEVVPYDSEIQARIAAELLKARLNPTLHERLRNRLSKDKYSKLMAATQPTRPNTRKGDFGEIIAALSLSTVFGLLVPVQKLRYKLRSSDQPTNIDVVGFRYNAEAKRITEVCYTESKLRTKSDANFAQQAHDQLQKTWLGVLPELHVFLGNVLAERNDPLLDPFIEYMADDTAASLSSFCIALHSDAAAWDREALDKLNQVTPLLDPLSIVVSKIANLNERVKNCFDAAGLALDDVDD